MRLNSILRLALVPAIIILLVTGCSGINSTQSISPLSFFLPGIVQAKPQPQKEAPIVPVSVGEPVRELAKAQ